jgi:MFS family permease
VLSIVQGVLVGRVVKSVGERRSFRRRFSAISIGLGLIPFVWNVPTLLTALGVLAIGMGFNNPALTSMVSRLTNATIKVEFSDCRLHCPAWARRWPGLGRLFVRRPTACERRT